MESHDDASAFTFISYSHDTKEHKDRVRRLAEQLISSGVQTALDQYHPFPPAGWPSWMARRIREAEFVVVACTETYYRRAMGLEKAGIGRGAAWESQIITQELYDAQGRNDKFIPVVFDEATRRFIPDFLRPYTTPNVSTEDGFVELLRILTDQPAYVAPPLGERISLPPITAARAASASSCRVDSSGDLVLLHPTDNGFFWVDAEQITEDANTALFTLKLESDVAVAEARNLTNAKTVGLAYNNTAFLADVKSAKLVHKGHADHLILEVRRSSSDYRVHGAILK